MQAVIKINETNLQIKEWNGQRVVTLTDIDRVHERLEGTAKKNFQNNRNYFLKETDYFEVTRKELREKYSPNSKPLKGNPNIVTFLFTESGYLMIVKSFTDSLAWEIQRDLVNTYFKFKEVIQSVEPMENGLILPQEQFSESLDRLETCAAIFQNMMQYSTINYKQQQDLLLSARRRINQLLGGTHSPEYKEWSRVYFKNLWLNFAEHFQCGTYKDLNPLFMEIALEYIQNWRYT